MGYKVCIIGSGNWGSVIAKIAAENVSEHPEMFHPTVKMWVYEEKVELPSKCSKQTSDTEEKAVKNAKIDMNLTDIINKYHENVKYLPDIKLPSNLVAVPLLKDAVSDADLWVFNLPHQFLPNISKQLLSIAQEANKNKKRILALSCIKGLEITNNKMFLACDYISTQLNIPCGVLSGANLAPEIAKNLYSETTIAFPPLSENAKMNNESDKDILEIWRRLFHRPYFHVSAVADVVGTSLGGALKNVIALATGFADGLGWGNNAKSAIMRRGLLEMVEFGNLFFPGRNVQSDTFLKESCGVADLITSCMGGRNARVGKAFVSGKYPKGTSVEQVEEKELKGMKAQGICTAEEVYSFLKFTEDGKYLDSFPLLVSVYQILYENKPAEGLPNYLDNATAKL